MLFRSTQLLVQAAGETYDGMLRLIPKLRPIAIDQLGLEGALLDMFNRLKITNPNVEFNLNVNFSKKTEDVQLAIYRIAQEAINNAIKHAAPRTINVNLNETSESIQLTIENDGQSPNQLSNSGHFGIEGMQERAHFLGGELSFDIPSTGGLVVQLTIAES